MKNIIIVVTFFLLMTNSIKAQGEDSLLVKKKYTPYELLSNYYNDDFKPYKKGAIYFGASLSLEDRTLENTQNIIQTVLEGDRLNFNILIKGGYYISDYNMVGLDINMFENKFQGDVFRDPDIIDSNSITRGYSFTPNYRTTIPLTKNDRLSFFTTAGLTFGVSNTLLRETKNIDEVQKSYSENYNFRFGLSSGVTFFAMENFAFEVELDVLGYELDIENKTKNETEESRDVRQNVDFKLNLLSLKFGIAYYL